MDSLLVKLLVGVAVIWLIQTILDAFAIKEPGHRIMFVITIVLVVIWLASGSVTLLLK